MNGRQLIERLLDHAALLDFQVIAVDQFGATESPVTDVRVHDGQLILDIAVPDHEERAETRHGRS